MSGASAVTVTSLVSSPRSSLTLTVIVVAVSTLTRGTTAFRKPDISTVTRYSTGSSCGAEKLPFSDVVRASVAPVPMSVMVTVAPGTTAPLRSVTVPAIPPLLVWATATVQKREAATAASGRRVLIRVSAGAGRRRSSYPYCLYASLFVRISKWEDKIHTWPAALFLDAERYGKWHSGTLLFCLSDLVASAARWHVQDSHRRRFRSQKRRGNFVRVMGDPMAQP